MAATATSHPALPDARRHAAGRLIERLAERLGIPTPPIIGEPTGQATVPLPPHRDRIVAALDEIDPDWRRLLGPA